MQESFLRRKNVEAMTGLSRSHIYRLMEEGKFPSQYQLSLQAVGWKLSEIEEWMASRERISRA